MRVRDWYFQGWERGANGELHYTGEYYALPEGKPRAAVLGLGGGLVALYLLTAFFPSEGGMWRIAAIPQLLELIPLIYLVMGGVRLARAKGPMTYRDWYASWRRIRTSAAWSLGITAAMAAAELAFIFAADKPAVGQELFYLSRVLGCAALSLFLWRYVNAHPCSQSVSK